MTSRYGFWLRPLLWISLVCFLTTACFIPYAPEMRGWRCTKNEDCLGGLKCFTGVCRAACESDLDCQRALFEKCLPIKFCCDAKAEICNGRDDDCDGTVDNGATCASGTCQDGKCS